MGIKISKAKAICIPIIAIIIAFFLALTIVCCAMSETITRAICPPVVNLESLNATRESGKALANQIEAEGAVLVKNDDLLPLSKDITSVNVFGRSSTDWIVSGSGSGQVLPEDGDASKNIDFLRALKEYGVDYNTSLSSMYRAFQGPMGIGSALGNTYSEFYRLSEPSITDRSTYTQKLLNDAKAYSDTAFVVLSRRAGESEDPTKVQYKNKAETDTTRHYLEISAEEENMLKYVAENYENVVVIINSTNVMELDFLDTIEGLDACLVVGPTGTKAAEAIPQLIYGDINPSGKLVDTYAYDMKTNINYEYSGYNGVSFYSNSEGLYEYNQSTNAGDSVRPGAPYVDYVEGIYVGYKWYETADAEGLWDDVDNEYGKGYEGVVQYPFGFGLSYTNFEWEVQSVSPSSPNGLTKDGTIEIKVIVTNKGNVTGKDIVQVYVTPEYKEGGIEKSHVNLVAFSKTADIKPNENQLVTLTFNVEDMASYDCYDKNSNGIKGYELEKGSYKVKLMTDSHNVAKVDFLSGKQDTDGIIEYNLDSDIYYEFDRNTGNKVENLFTGDKAVDGISIDGSDTSANIPYISRASFTKTITKPQTARAMTSNLRAYNLYAGTNSQDETKANAWNTATTDEFGKAVNNSDVTFGKSGNLKVYEGGKVTELGLKLGADYDAVEWEALLDQVTMNEAKSLVGSGMYGNSAVNSIGKPGLRDLDGPIQIKGFSSAPRGTGFPSTIVLAQTWSKKLAYDFGLAFGKEMDSLGLDGCYGPAMNLHRSPFQGRNYEYYSEDGFLSGTLLSNVITGGKNAGKYFYIKHFALAQTETSRDSMYTWTTEQALRETYLQSFKIVVRNGATGLMTSYNRIGGVWAGGSTALNIGVLENEWGFNGSIITDFSDNNQYMNMDQAIRSGGDLGMNVGLKFDYSKTNRAKQALRSSVKDTLYMWLNAKYTNSNYNADADIGEQITTASVTPPFVWWIPLLIDLDILAVSGCAFWLYMLFRKKTYREAKTVTNQNIIIEEDRHE